MAQPNEKQFERLERQAIVAALARLCDPERTMDNLKAGDTVQLKSGGPIMAIREIDGEWVTCDWFDSGGKPNHKQFNLSQLKAAKPEKEWMGGGLD